MNERTSTRVGAVVLTLITAACTNEAGDAAPSTTTVAPQPSATILTADIEAADVEPAAADSDFYCGTFGAEQPPTLLAIDLATGTPAWRMCSPSALPVMMAGRADGATVLLEQDGRGGSTLVGIDDTGAEIWRRPTRMDGMSFFVSGPIAITVAAEVEAIDAATGDVRWTHPVADGTPLGTAQGLVIEVDGGPYALSTETATGETEPSTLRALDAATGAERWTRPVDLEPVPMPSQYSPTVGDGVVAIVSGNGTTTIIDAVSGQDLRTEPGELRAQGGLLLGWDPTNPSGMGSMVDPATGAVWAPVIGSIVQSWMVGAYSPSAAGVLVASDPPTGPAATLTLIDPVSGAIQWEVPYRQPIGRSADHVFVVDESTLQMLDATNGEVVVDYEPPTELVTFTNAVATDGLIIVSGQWRGAPSGTGSPLPDTAPDCTGGSVLLDTNLDDGSLVVQESSNGTVFCVEFDGQQSIGNVPSVPAPDPRFDSMGFFEPGGGWYTLTLPEGLEDVTVVDEQGEAMPAARGVAGNYLVVFQPGIKNTDDGGPAMVERRIQLVRADGTVIAEVSFSGFAGDGFETATFEDFLACVRDHGVDMPTPPSPGSTTAVPRPSAPEVLREAWAACRDLFYGYIRSQQYTPEFIENQQVIDDCVAESGFYSLMGQPVDPAAYNVAYDLCRSSSPGQVALEECLGVAGLSTGAEGSISGGPHPPEQAVAAWNSCRDIYITSFVQNPIVADRVVGPFDCVAALGWIPAVMDPLERSRADVIAALQGCRPPTG